MQAKGRTGANGLSPCAAAKHRHFMNAFLPHATHNLLVQVCSAVSKEHERRTLQAIRTQVKASRADKLQVIRATCILHIFCTKY